MSTLQKGKIKVKLRLYNHHSKFTMKSSEYQHMYQSRNTKKETAVKETLQFWNSKSWENGFNWICFKLTVLFNISAFVLNDILQ